MEVAFRTVRNVPSTSYTFDVGLAMKKTMYGVQNRDFVHVHRTRLALALAPYFQEWFEESKRTNPINAISDNIPGLCTFTATSFIGEKITTIDLSNTGTGA